MPRRKKLTLAEQAQKEQEALNTPVRLDGKGEAPVVQDLLSPDFLQKSNLEASEIALFLQQIIRGQNSLLEQNSQQIASLRERQDQIDQRIADELASNRKFIEEVLDRAEDLKRTGLEHDKLIAQGVAQYEKAKQDAAAMQAIKTLEYEQQLAREEKVMVVSGGQLITTMQNGQQVAALIPEEVRIRHKIWVLPPGIPVNVPKSVAEFLAQRNESKIETAKRQAILQKNYEVPKLAEEWNKIGGSRTDAMPVG